jgi:c-di-GMP phosphodiesterase
MPGCTDVVVGRQGVHDADGIVGYELLFSSVPVLGASPLTGNEMTADLLFGAMSIGLSRLVADRMIFCKADRGVLTGEIPVMLPPERTVIEVPDSLARDAQAVAGCKRLVDAGYALAVENSPWGGSDNDAVLPLASIMKVDVAFALERQLVEVVDRCRANGVRPLATRVNSADEIPQLANLGFSLFQGFGLDRPNVVRGRTLAPSTASGLMAASQLLGAEPEFDELEEILRRDPALAYHIMQLASMGRMGELRRNISTIRDALVMAGLMQIRNWLALLLARPSGNRTNAYDALLATLLRARACELLAGETDRSQGAVGFAAGMLSALDILLEVPLDEVATSLPLSEELRAAAFGGETPLARIVQDVTTYHLGDSGPGVRSGLSRERLDTAFARAFPWAVECAAAADPTHSPVH